MPGTDLEEDALALRKAWGYYLLLGVIPPLAMILMIFYLIFTSGTLALGPRVMVGNLTAGWIWFIGGMLWIGVTVPVSFYLRRRYWDEYYRGGVVSPSNYIKGNMAIWLPLVVAGVAGFIGFGATRYVANLFTSLLAFMIFLTMFPNGHAMTRPIGDHDDPGVYEEPR